MMMMMMMIVIVNVLIAQQGNFIYLFIYESLDGSGEGIAIAKMSVRCFRSETEFSEELQLRK